MFDHHFFRDEAAESSLPVGGKVLMVDDEPRFVESLRPLLSLKGFDQQICNSGKNALSLLKREKFDLILLDLNLGDMTGHDVMEQIKLLGIETPVIVISGDNSIDAAIDALRNGVYDFVRKPFEPEQLIRAIENAVYKTRLERANQEIHEKLEQSRNVYRYLVDSSPDLIYTLDENGCFTFVNERVEMLVGYTKEELLGKHYSALVYEEDIDRAKYVFNERRTDHRTTHNIELRLKCRLGDEQFRHFENNFVTIVLKSKGLYDSHGGGGPFIGTYGVARDISDRKKAEELIHYQAYHDALTDLPNRTLFKDRLGLAVEQAKRSNEQFAVMFLDLDRFKLVNDSLGHHFGDELLKIVSTRLKKVLRKGDTLARVGGDEFNLLLPKLKSPDHARKLAAKFLDQLVSPFKLEEHEAYISGSIGIAIYPDHGETPEALIKSADIAMYHVKWEGKNGCMLYNKNMNEVFHRKLSMENELRRALDADQFILYYQPQVDVINSSIVGMEALIRWQHPEYGLVPPNEFIPLAEETGLIVRITEWVLKKSSEQFRLWHDMGFGHVRLSLNFSPQDVERKDFVGMVKKQLGLNGIGLDGLEVEITESTLMRDMENSISKLKALANGGSKIAVDDFGTGYSSLSYLKRFPINTIKIDKSFVHDVTDGMSEVPIVTAITAIADGFKMRLIAEGVETSEQMEYLKSRGCQVMQGFLFSRPLSTIEATNALLNQQNLFIRSGSAIH